MQKEISGRGRLLDENGELIQKGYAKNLLLDYDRDHIKAKCYRIKEWDYYLVYNDDFGVALTIADNSYMALLSVSLLDFKNAFYKTTSIIKPFTFGRLKLPSTSKIGDISYKDKRIEMEFLHDGISRRLNCKMKNFHGEKDFECNLTLSEIGEDSMVIATPFKEDKKAFYYNQKINCMKAEGTAVYNDKTYIFSKDNSFGTLDWGRGVWTYKNTWYWGSASGMVNGKNFGFNIGYGFGDTSAASENMIFYDGKAHKLDEVTFNIPKDGNEYCYMKPWTFTSNDGRFEMDFIPLLDRKDNSSVGIISSKQHQVFGKFTGKVVLNDGTVVEIRDFFGFAERVENKW